MRVLLLVFVIQFVGLFSEESETKGTIVEEQMRPEFLYKILSTDDWKASHHLAALQLSSDDDKAFIHLATKEQLARIQDKYWDKVPEYYILKIKAKLLIGKLVLETNPGGANRYYHLYNGSIPLEAVVETRLINKEPVSTCSGCMPVIDIGDPVLRKSARTLSKEEILSEEGQQLIQKMIATMRAAPGVGLAAPQVGVPLQIAVVEDLAAYHTYLTPEQLEERGRREVPLHVIINPKLYLEEGESAEFFEGCLSIPHLMGIVPRAKRVRVECLNERGEAAVIHANGWHARILQHEIDHLNGTLFIDRAYLRTVMTQDNYMRLWKSKSMSEILKSLK